MKNKIKSLSSAAAVMALAMPALVRAAFDPTAGGDTGLPSGKISEIITKIMEWLLTMVGIIGVIGFAIAGILYLTAAGDEGKIDKAKNAMLYSIIGVIVAIVGVVALQAAKNLLNADETF